MSRLEKISSQGTDGKVIYVTSAKDGEGKSFVASWLANTAASITDKKVLIIDGNMESPRLGKLFGIQQEEGFSDVLVDRDWQQIKYCGTTTPNLHILPAGTQRLPGLLFQQRVMDEFLSAAKSRFDLIFVDSASIIRSGANSLAALADGIFVVIDSSSTRWQVLDYAMSELNIDKEKIIGAALNKKVQYIPSFIYDRL